MPPVTLVWFRRDLRLDDNPALAAAAARGPIVPLFIWAPEEEHPWEPGAASRWWLHGSLCRLAESLAAKGTPLLVRGGPSLDTLRSVAEEYGVTHVCWNRCYEPAIVARDTTIKQAIQADGLEAESFNGGLLYEPLKVKTKQGTPYQVFTPFWKSLMASDEPDTPRPGPRKLHAAAAVSHRKPANLSIDSLGLLPSINWDATMRETWTPGEAGGKKTLQAFLATGLGDYGDERDRPDHRGTSRLSPYLHFGEISPRRVWHAAREAAGGRPVAQLTGSAEVFLREIGWREFASHLLFHFPHTTDAPLRENYAKFPWVRDPVGLRAWQQGHTGYPVVDAGMRQLWQTGWMHNRVRMIVASFLVKDLRVSWLAGAKWFWDTLVDADLAANTLGWQWAAGCGADAAPYFRIFNPTSQGKKFDPEGRYVGRYVPELAGLPAAVIHQPEVVAPSQLAAAGVTLGTNYAEPIVNHAEARQQALAALATLKQS